MTSLDIVVLAAAGFAAGTINAANLKRAHAQIESATSRGKIVLEGW